MAVAESSMTRLFNCDLFDPNVIIDRLCPLLTPRDALSFVHVIIANPHINRKSDKQELKRIYQQVGVNLCEEIALDEVGITLRKMVETANRYALPRLLAKHPTANAANLAFLKAAERGDVLAIETILRILGKEEILKLVFPSALKNAAKAKRIDVLKRLLSPDLLPFYHERQLMDAAYCIPLDRQWYEIFDLFPLSEPKEHKILSATVIRAAEHWHVSCLEGIDLDRLKYEQFWDDALKETTSHRVMEFLLDPKNDLLISFQTACNVLNKYRHKDGLVELFLNSNKFPSMNLVLALHDGMDPDFLQIVDRNIHNFSWNLESYPYDLERHLTDILDYSCNFECFRVIEETFNAAKNSNQKISIPWVLCIHTCRNHGHDELADRIEAYNISIPKDQRSCCPKGR